ncbi:SAM-dependent methyltransferase [Streptomyces sp. NPDC048606]|uniref:SAM-dependent methyltransferase n=1 Tax=Streptomyces sp. NPDC048606 TaxID=3154726 RepID=UPI00342F160A
MSRPAVARVCAFISGGTEHFPADRALGAALLRRSPWLGRAATACRTHGRQSVTRLATLGIGQFLDLGCGMPQPFGHNTHDFAQSVDPAATVVYVDDDPTVWGHARTVFTESLHDLAMRADVTRVAELVTHPVIAGLDHDRPIAVLLHELLPWIGDEPAARLLAGLREWLPEGSMLSVIHTAADSHPAAMSGLVDLYHQAGILYRPRTMAELRALVPGWLLEPPGITTLALPGPRPANAPAYAQYAFTARPSRRPDTTVRPGVGEPASDGRQDAGSRFAVLRCAPCTLGASGPSTPEEAAAKEEGAFTELHTAQAFLRQGWQVAELLARCGSVRTESQGIADTIRAAITYRLYTPTQPLTLPQLAGDLSASAGGTVEALHELLEEGVLVREPGRNLFWVPRRDGVALYSPDFLTRLRVRLMSGIHPPGRTLPSADDLSHTLGVNTMYLQSALAMLAAEGLLQAVGDRDWVVTPEVLNVPGPPRLRLPRLAPGVVTDTRIDRTVAVHRHATKRPPAGDSTVIWQRLRMTAAHVLATPAPDGGARSDARAVLEELATALAPHEPRARMWHARCIATAIESVRAQLLPPGGQR